MKKQLSAIVLAVTVTATPAIAKTTSVDSIAVTQKIHLLRVNSTMGNTSSVLFTGSEGTLLIEPNFDGSEGFIREKLKQLGGKKIDYVTSSHIHRDHTEQYPAFLDEAVGIMPEQQRIELQGADFLKDRLPPVTFTDQTRLHLNDETVILSTLPTKVGHTNGDLVAYFEKAQVLYVGDYLFIDGYPIIDRDVGDLKGYLANIKHLLSNYPENTKVLAGHTTFDGAPYSAISMAQYRQYYEDLNATIGHIKSQIKQGKSTEQIVADGLPKRFAKYGQKPYFVSEKRWIEYVAKYIS